jgi:hypothetical protein
VTFVHARSGDKGGDANVGLWVAHDGSDRYDARVEVFVLPNLGAVNVVVHGLLGKGVAASTRLDPQAKGLGETFRARLDVPEALR